MSTPFAGSVQVIGSTGPVAGALIDTFVSGTLTPQAAYTTASLSIPHSNPIVCDSLGAATVWLNPALSYRIRYRNPDGTIIPYRDFDNVQANVEAVPTAATLPFTPSGTGAIATTAQEKMRESVSLFDFMTPAQITAVKQRTSTDDHTPIWDKAKVEAALIHVPEGTWNLSGWRPLSSTKLLTDGRGVLLAGGVNYAGVVINQYATGTPAIEVLANADQYTDKTGTLRYYGQLRGIDLSGFLGVGKAGSTVPFMRITAQGVFAVHESNFDFSSRDTFAPVEVIATDANAFYRNTLKVTSEGILPTGQTGTTQLMGGAYNEINLFLVNCANALAFKHSQTNSEVTVVTDCGQEHAGYLNDIYATIENWFGGTAAQGVSNIGRNNRIRMCSIINVPRAKTGIGISLNSTPSTIEGFNIGAPSAALALSARPGTGSATLAAPWALDTTGAYPIFFNQALTFTAALVGAESATLTAAWGSATGVERITFSDGSIRRAYFTSGSTAVVWLGAVTATAAITVSIRRVAVLTSGATTCTWVGVVDLAFTTATVEYAGPQYPLNIPLGASGSISDSEVAGCQYRLEEYLSDAILGRFQFLGDNGSLTWRDGTYKDAGSKTFAAATTAVVTLNRLQPDTNYRVSLTPYANKTFWVTDKTAAGFTLNASASSSDVVDWEVTR